MGIALALAAPLALGAESRPGCKVLGRVVSVQGLVEIQSQGNTQWTALKRPDAPLCDGDSNRVGPGSRSGVFIEPENGLRVDQDSTVTVRRVGDITEVELLRGPAGPLARSCGAVYNLSRCPGKFRVLTPHTNAMVEGTELLVRLACDRTVVSVLEGKVAASDRHGGGEYKIPAGSELTLGAEASSAVRLQARPLDAIDWTIYYPPVEDAGTAPQAEPCALSPDVNVCLLRGASAYLRAGQVAGSNRNTGRRAGRRR